MSALGPFALAFVAGVLSFSAPCCLPLMPGYVSFVSGVTSDTPGEIALRRRTMTAATLFVLGFATTFTLMGVGASELGGAILRHRLGLTKVAGVFVLVMGLATLGVLRIPFMNREMRPGLGSTRPGPAGAFPLGVAFAVGWTPCIGPVLAAILALATTTGGALRGGALLLAYSVGLGIPFLLLARGYAGTGRAFSWLRAHARGVELVGGGVLVAMGLLMITGVWGRLFIPIVRFFSQRGWPPV